MPILIIEKFIYCEARFYNSQYMKTKLEIYSLKLYYHRKEAKISEAKELEIWETTVTESICLVMRQNKHSLSSMNLLVGLTE